MTITVKELTGWLISTYGSIENAADYELMVDSGKEEKCTINGKDLYFEKFEPIIRIRENTGEGILLITEEREY